MADVQSSNKAERTLSSKKVSVSKSIIVAMHGRVAAGYPDSGRAVGAESDTLGGATKTEERTPE